ncbi:hypothetical protein N306_09305, partial [Opisthocomus hoazin]
SPMICQIVVDAALKEVRKSYKQIYLHHYMDDILLAAETQNVLLTAFAKLESSLKIYGLQIAPEKVQTEQPWKYVGWKLFTSQVFPQPLRIVDQVITLHDLQKLLGTINWVQLLLGITTEELSPLFTLSKGDSDLLSSRKLMPEAKTVLQKVSDKIATSFASRINVKLPINLYI